VKILIVTERYPPMIGGAGAVMYNLAEHAPDQIQVLTCEYDHEGRRICTSPQPPSPVHVHRIPRFQHRPEWLPPGKLRAVFQITYNHLLLYPSVRRKFLRVLERLQPDVICIGTSGCFWLVDDILKWRKDAKIVMYVHGEEVPDDSYFGRVTFAALKKASGLVAVSSYTRNALINIGMDGARIVRITNGVDASRFQPGARDQEIIDRYRLVNHRVLLTLARLDERKGQDMMIRSLPEIRKAVPDVIYLVVGDGSYGPHLRALVSELHLEDVVVFTGAASDEQVLSFYRTCDVYVMANRTTDSGDTEGFGLVFLEAGACGKPVIGGRAGGVPDAVLEGVTGLLVDGRSENSIAEACIRLLNDLAMRESFGASGLANARKNGWQEKTDQFVDYCRLIAGQ
jgi:phosphatidylinositol alpha-1,6-mannosyltransferase